MAFGLLEVSRYERVTQVGDSPLWMDDGRIVIGSSENSLDGYRRGAVYVFDPDTSRFAQQSTIFPPIPQIGAFSGFGSWLATSGNWLAVKTKLTNNQVTLCMFEATNAVDFAFRTNLVGTGFDGERFGDARMGFAMHGRWLAAARYGNGQARIFIYRVNDAGVWEQKQVLVHPGYTSTYSNSAKLDLFGRTLVFANPSGDGRVDVWRLSDDGEWAWETQIIPTGLGTGAALGTGLEVAEDRIFLGAPEFEKTTDRGGAIFIFKRVNDVWTEESRILASELSTPEFIGKMLAYSNLDGECLAQSTGARLTMFQPNENGIGWKRVSGGHPGRYFHQWESPAGHFESYQWDRTNSVPDSIAVRAHQVLTGYGSVFASLHEHGWHSIEVRKFTSDPDCKRRPLFYVPIGAPREGYDRMGDLDSDGISDFAEIFHGTYLDEENVMSNGLALIETGGKRKVQWPRAADPALLVKGQAEWSTDLSNWTANGITETTVGQDVAGRDIVEVQLPENSRSGFLRLSLTIADATEEQ
ncbi:MAG: hypothetical protein ACTHMT_13170 [Verrucomicrobiota bacterium]